jgi:hypothetical protein
VVTFYPAAGRRALDSGAFGSTGSNGVYWSSAVSSANGYDLDFSSAVVNPTIGSNRAFGFSVRCVQHLLLFEKLNLLYG